MNESHLPDKGILFERFDVGDFVAEAVQGLDERLLPSVGTLFYSDELNKQGQFLSGIPQPDFQDYVVGIGLSGSDGYKLLLFQGENHDNRALLAQMYDLMPVSEQDPFDAQARPDVTVAQGEATTILLVRTGPNTGKVATPNLLNLLEKSGFECEVLITLNPMEMDLKKAIHVHPKIKPKPGDTVRTSGVALPMIDGRHDWGSPKRLEPEMSKHDKKLDAVAKQRPTPQIAEPADTTPQTEGADEAKKEIRELDDTSFNEIAQFVQEQMAELSNKLAEEGNPLPAGYLNEVDLIFSDENRGDLKNSIAKDLKGFEDSKRLLTAQWRDLVPSDSDKSVKAAITYLVAKDYFFQFKDSPGDKARVMEIAKGKVRNRILKNGNYIMEDALLSQIEDMKDPVFPDYQYRDSIFDSLYEQYRVGEALVTVFKHLGLNISNEYAKDLLVFNLLAIGPGGNSKILRDFWISLLRGPGNQALEPTLEKDAKSIYEDVAYYAYLKEGGFEPHDLEEKILGIMSKQVVTCMRGLVKETRDGVVEWGEGNEESEDKYFKPFVDHNVIEYIKRTREYVYRSLSPVRSYEPPKVLRKFKSWNPLMRVMDRGLAEHRKGRTSSNSLGEV